MHSLGSTKGQEGSVCHLRYIRVGFFTDYRNLAWYYYATNETTYATWLASVWLSTTWRSQRKASGKVLFPLLWTLAQYECTSDKEEKCAPQPLSG